MKLNRIKAVLSEKGISQTWLAKKLDKSFSMVNAYACNRIQPNLDTLQQIAEILQVDLREVLQINHLLISELFCIFVQNRRDHEEKSELSSQSNR